MAEKNKKTIEIKGVIGSSGKSQGRVKIVADVDKISDFKDGDILVARITSPKFVPFMKKSGAIVVDEGGILCHAAIIAREFKKPCIVDTKVATKMLKDGDLVEVDAEKNGIIKVIN